MRVLWWAVQTEIGMSWSTKLFHEVRTGVPLAFALALAFAVASPPRRPAVSLLWLDVKRASRGGDCPPHDVIVRKDPVD
jgi:hypothetical protein